MGEGFSGTTIKDTETKPKGVGIRGAREVGMAEVRGRGELWGEKADNCT